MTNYTDHTKWVEVEDYENQYYLQEYEQYQPDCLVGIFNSLIQKAEAKGLEGCHLRFHSHTEPYEDWLGSPSVMVVGYRKHSVDEKEEIKEQMKVEALAKELGVSVYEAKIVMDLKKRGKL
tara:strand:- start:195 stop:557 length:363 start_codon:yes stop_codon:yes gene_type:complete